MRPDAMNLRERLAERLQAGIPLTERPYREIGDESGLEEGAVLELVRGLIEEKVVRSFGAFVDFRRLGYAGLLFGVAVPEGRREEVFSRLVSRNEVTHAYLRDHAVDLWCTALVKGRDGARSFAEEVLRVCRCPFVLLTTERRLKLRPTFRFIESGEEDEEPVEPMTAGTVPSGEDIAALSLLQIGFPVAYRPFDEAAERLETTTPSLLERLRRLKDSGVLRRVGASLDHRRVGYGANALVAWDAADATEAGGRASRFPWVSHCYLRGVAENTLPFAWPYPLYTMLHARTREDLDARLREMEKALSPRAAAIMPTVRELKKTRYLL